MARRYERSSLRSDLVAGAIVAVVAVPSSLAMGEFAGLPVVFGLYATLLPLVGYAVFGGSRRASPAAPAFGAVAGLGLEPGSDLVDARAKVLGWERRVEERTLVEIASMSTNSGSRATPARAPATMVSGSPIASRRRGTAYSPRSATRSIREASEKSTTVRIASATKRTDSLPIVESSQPSPSSLRSTPPATNTIAAVTTNVESRRETAANARSRSAIAAPERSRAIPRHRDHLGEWRAGR